MIAKIMGVLGSLIILFGVKFCNKSATADEVKESLAVACAEEESCLEILDIHYDSCFEGSYVMKKRGSRLNAQSLASCLNNAAGEQLFVLQEQAD